MRQCGFIRVKRVKPRRLDSPAFYAPVGGEVLPRLFALPCDVRGLLPLAPSATPRPLPLRRRPLPPLVVGRAALLRRDLWLPSEPSLLLSCNAPSGRPSDGFPPSSRCSLSTSSALLRSKKRPVF